jgi:hypothetical protein
MNNKKDKKEIITALDGLEIQLEILSYTIIDQRID